MLIIANSKICSDRLNIKKNERKEGKKKKETNEWKYEGKSV